MCQQKNSLFHNVIMILFIMPILILMVVAERWGCVSWTPQEEPGIDIVGPNNAWTPQEKTRN